MNSSKYISIGMLAHVDAGKTTLSEAMLYRSGAIRKLGRVDNKDTFLDTGAMERARGITIFSKQAHLSLDDYDITLLDTPGHVDFSAEMERTLWVLDYAILVISGTDGIQAHTETVWRLLMRHHIPTFIFVNKMDMSGTNKTRIMEQLKNKLSDSCVDFTMPDNEEIALCDEKALNDYLEGKELTDEAVSELISKRALFPCFFGSALKLDGVDKFLEGLSKYIKVQEYSDEFGARIFKIARDEQNNRLTYLKVTGGILKARMNIEEEKINQIRIYSGNKFTTVPEIEAGGICAVTGLIKTQAGQSLGCDNGISIPFLEPVLTYKINLPQGTDPVQMLPKLRVIEEEEPQLHIEWNEMLNEIQVQVMGPVLIEVLQSIIKERFGIDVTFGVGNIVYKETIADTVEGVGHFEPLRHYAEVHILMEPLEAGSGMQYECECSEDVLAKNWQRLIYTHLCEKSHVGVLTGSKLTDVKITLKSGRAHIKHTEGGDFRQAVYRAVRQGLMQAESVLLEPYYEFEITLPSENIGRVMADIEKMSGKCKLISEKEAAVITGTAPVSEFLNYQKDVSAFTKGRGKVTCRMAGYMPCHNQKEVVEKIGYVAESDMRNPADSVFCAHGSGFIVPWNEVSEYMHLESILNPDKSGSDRDLYVPQKGRGRVVSDEWIGTEEVDAILRETYFANSRNGDNERKKLSKRKTESAQPVIYKGTEKTSEKRKNYLLVDGYNIIHAWDELHELAMINMDSARGRLIDILCNYQGIKGCELIAVFDAYRVSGHREEFLDYHNIHIVYTKEAETADHYIEKFAHENGRKYNVTVATSDGVEQVIIRGQGCLLLSARDFKEEVERADRELKEQYGVL